jgi:mannose-6-phosphate isomerase-like protein (cupin superfamily)
MSYEKLDFAGLGRECPMAKRVILILCAYMFLCACVTAQTHGNQLDPYFSDWHKEPVRTVYGHLAEQDILTRGDALHPSTHGAVLRFVSAYEYATLPSHLTTSPIHLKGQQQIYFIVSGSGKAVAGTQSIELSPNIAVLMPAELEFTLTNTGDQPLTMYLIEEPTSSEFHPNSSMLAKDENALPFSTTDLQWSYMVKKIFVASDGLATLKEVSTVYVDPLTVGRPQSTGSPETESVWTALRGTGIAFVSNDLRRQPPGVTFAEVPDGKTPYSIINPNQDAQLKFLHFEHEPTDTAQAAPVKLR